MSYLRELPLSHSFGESTLRHLTLAAASASPPGVDSQRWSELKGVMGVEELGHVVSCTNDLRYYVTSTRYIYVSVGVRGLSVLLHTTHQIPEKQQQQARRESMQTYWTVVRQGSIDSPGAANAMWTMSEFS